ncbi:phosphopantetheine-binding protein [Streptomyces sp. NBC_01294]|uniref:phosphopantetheine-binding protein n=1 Tax=Streptomyces sp. NBC_01294 TaxID=2903815 RepID=UPI002DDB821E|nr:phosphopantetheine-binding protein [Streptomyces sp. NBC_01294]WRZ62343.1 phosphopantetheine-binding protein [Streptomyces sp. NBC_01294]
MSDEFDTAEFDCDSLIQLLREEFAVPADRLRRDATLEQVGLDSLALLEVVVVLQGRAGVHLEDEFFDIRPSDTLERAAETLKTALSASPVPAVRP